MSGSLSVWFLSINVRKKKDLKERKERRAERGGFSGRRRKDA